MTAPQNQMTAIERARRFAEMGRVEDALNAYTAALRQETAAPEERLEAACAVFQYGGDYKIAYDAFLALYREGNFVQDIRAILDEAFYLPNVKQQEKRYKKNCKLLKSYPYLFKKDFPAFEELPIKFYPYDDNGVLPFPVAEERFDAYTDINDPQITHYFFRDLEKPIFAKDIFSQYELEYLKDNVRRSDWVARENHIYLHYPDWGVFCSYLQLLDMKPLLEDEKFVFLIGEEESLYPIDFKERFGIDYSQYPVKPVHIRECHRLVWHTQLSAHNGGDFFNEILHEHPNMTADSSRIFSRHVQSLNLIRDCAQEIIDGKGLYTWGAESTDDLTPEILQQLTELKKVTLKDALVAFNLGSVECVQHLDANARIVPAIFFQPHFWTMQFAWKLHETGGLEVSIDEVREMLELGLMQQFKYIKTFTPMRRHTVSFGATVHFMHLQSERGYALGSETEEEKNKLFVMGDCLYDRILNRTFMIDEKDRIFRDSRLIRFEDAKLNPTAVFTALAEFLDLPYTESMTYCSDMTGRDPNGQGFNIEAVYRTYEGFSDESERQLLEYLLRDVYEFYGYGFNYYDGKPMTQDEVEALLEKCEKNLELYRNSWWKVRDKISRLEGIEGEELDAYIESECRKGIERHREMRRLAIKVLSYGLPFCNEKGEHLKFMKPLELDAALMERPLYR